MKKKKGYPILMIITLLFTLTAIYFLITSITSETKDIAVQMTSILIPLLLAGMTCVIRKRFFTEME